jgi:hypothetical protein
MKHKYFLALMAAIVLGITGFAYAQQEYYDDSGVHYLQPAQVTSTPAMHEHAGKTGKLKLRAAMELGDVLLQPGNYEVRHIDTGKEHFVEFSQIVNTKYTVEGMSPYESQVVARVNCTREPLDSTVARTELLPETDGTTARLEIRGEKVEHLF